MGNPDLEPFQRAIALSRPTTNASISGQHPGVHNYLVTQDLGKTVEAQAIPSNVANEKERRRVGGQNPELRKRSVWATQLRERPRKGAVANPHWDENSRHLESTDVRFLGQSRTHEHTLSINLRQQFFS
ncbi:hypothetical protein VM1G_08128 [Cytospora mali]|uniref:Uncharacterized protein n=1 Tax=Cytospora mali TaxID=578113 RepID=A0A194W8B0_CYTMA|nr:hypothetical protein VM1G_08128 [Valsa mali]